MESIKRSPEAVLSYGILEAIGLTPPQIEQRLLDVFAQKVTAVMMLASRSRPGSSPTRRRSSPTTSARSRRSSGSLAARRNRPPAQ